MVEFKPKKSVALSGVVAGNTALCSVGKSGNDLHYRGFAIADLAEADLTAIRSFVPTVSGVDAAGLLPEFTRIQGNSIAFIVNIGVGATIDAVNYSKQPADNSRGDFEADSSAVVDTSIVILIAVVVFGLSMDYELFLLSRIREEHLSGKSNVESVAVGSHSKYE